jgi:hypothetical protein
MTNDPIVEEVRAVRDEIARENHYDLDTIFAMLRKAEEASGTPHVTLPPRNVDAAAARGAVSSP